MNNAVGDDYIGPDKFRHPPFAKQVGSTTVTCVSQGVPGSSDEIDPIL